jgi:hypothetical protein
MGECQRHHPPAPPGLGRREGGREGGVQGCREGRGVDEWLMEAVPGVPNTTEPSVGRFLCRKNQMGCRRPTTNASIAPSLPPRPQIPVQLMDHTWLYSCVSFRSMLTRHTALRRCSSMKRVVRRSNRSDTLLSATSGSSLGLPCWEAEEREAVEVGGAKCCLRHARAEAAY